MTVMAEMGAAKATGKATGIPAWMFQKANDTTDLPLAGQMPNRSSERGTFVQLG